MNKQKPLFFECTARTTKGGAATLFFASYSAETMQTEAKRLQLLTCAPITKEALTEKLDPSVGPMLVAMAEQELETLEKPVSLVCDSTFAKEERKAA